MSQIHIESLNVERCMASIAKMIPWPELQNLRYENLRIVYAKTLCDLVMRLDQEFAGVAKERISIHRQWPRDWWEALKERWFPAWAKRRWPVRYNRVDVEQQIYGAVCPHIPLPHQRDNRACFKFLLDAQQRIETEEGA